MSLNLRCNCSSWPRPLLVGGCYSTEFVLNELLLKYIMGHLMPMCIIEQNLKYFKSVHCTNTLLLQSNCDMHLPVSRFIYIATTIYLSTQILLVGYKLT